MVLNVDLGIIILESVIFEAEESYCNQYFFLQSVFLNDVRTCNTIKVFGL